MARLSVSQRRARARADRGLQFVELAKDELGEALEQLSSVCGFQGHYERLEKLHTQIRKLRERLIEASKGRLDLTAEAKKEEQAKEQRLAARVLADRRRRRSRSTPRKGVQA